MNRISSVGIVTLILMVCSCSDGGDTVEGYTGEWIQTTVTETPFALSFIYAGDELTALAGPTVPAAPVAPALYIYDTWTGGRVDLAGTPPQKTVEEDVTTLIYQTTDGRSATVVIGPGQQGAASVRFEVEDLTPTERLCADFNVAASEGFYGLMERVVPGFQNYSWEPGMKEGFNLRGQTMPLLVTFTLSVYSPFYVSSGNYGVYVESDWPGIYRFGVDRRQNEAPSQVSLEYEGPSLTFQIIPGATPIDVTERYSQIIGTTIMPPRWAFGPWRWRNDVYNLPTMYDGTPANGPYNSMIMEDILMMEALGIPCSLYWVDRPWATGDFGYDDFEWDTNRLPNPLAMIDWLEGKNTKFMLWVAPWAVGDMAVEAEQKDYLVIGAVPSPPQEAKLIDLTNPEAVTWWQDAMIARINEGVAGFKLDRGDEKVPEGEFFTGFYKDGTSFREGHNPYPMWYARSVRGAFDRAGVKDAIVMPRAAWVGSQRYATPWGGDSWGSSWGLRSAMIGAQRSAAMNFPIWGSDTCGYDPMAPREVCARWFAFSAFTPLMEVGPTGNYAPWSMAPEGETGEVTEDGYSYEPIYDEELVAVWIFYARLHTDLMDYTYDQAQLAHEKGTPIIRSMIFTHPDETAYNDTFDQYYYGPDLLVAPIWQEGMTQKPVFIPHDGVWIDAWTGETAAAGTKVDVDVPLHKVPIFIRKGAKVSLGDLNERWAQAQELAAIKPVLSELLKQVH
jgi:alpha-glucosidase (family GH31 glycosyl hydrolase)